MENIITVIVPNISFFNKNDDFEKQCYEFLKLYKNNMRIITNNNETNDNDDNENNDDNNDDVNNNNDNITNNENSTNNIDNDDNIDITNNIDITDIINNDNNIDITDNINNNDNNIDITDINDNNIDNNNIDNNNNKNIKIPGGLNSFISLKMEIDTTLLFKLIIFLMIICIIIIILFILHIEFTPIRKYKIPLDYNYYTIQPPYHNVKRWDINNKNNGVISSLKQLKSNLYDKPKIKTNAEQIKDDIKEMVDADTPKETFFSSSYNFGI